MKYFYLCIFTAFIGLPFTGKTQFQYSFQKTYSTSGPSCEAEDLAELPGGNIIVAATRSIPVVGGGFQANAYLMKLEADGDTIWTREIGVAGSREYLESLALLPNGQIILAGSILDTASTGNADALLILADTNGNMLWQKRIGGADDDFANAVKPVNGGFIIGGTTYTNTAGNGDAWLLKIGSNGDSLWSRTFGGPLYDDCWDICLAPDGGYILTGGNYSFATGGTLDDAWLIKTDSLGNQHWMKHYGLANRVDWSWAVTPFRENGSVKGYVFTGIRNSGENFPQAAYGDLHFVKVDTGGNVIWDKTLVQAGGFRQEGRDIRQTADGGFLICGYRLSPSVNGQMFYVLKADSAGNKTWDTSFGGNNQAYYQKNIIATSDGGFMVAGNLSTPAPSQYMMLTKFSAAVTGVSHVNRETLDLQLFPNPNRGNFRVMTGLKGTGTARLSVFNTAGQLVHRQETVNRKQGDLTEVDIKERLTPGVYLLHVEAGGKTGSLRFTVE